MDGPLKVVLGLLVLSTATGEYKHTLKDDMENELVEFSENLRELNSKKTVVEEVSGESGTIDFKGTEFSDLKRKIWVIQGNENKWNVSFALVEGNLGQNAHLSVWSIPASTHLGNGSEVIDWRKEVLLSGVNVVLITLSMMGNSELSELEHPSFKLTFRAKMAVKSPVYVNSKEVIRNEGLQSISYPPENIQNYHRNSYFYSLIAPSSGNPFRLTLKYMDVPGTPPQCGKKWFAVYVLRDLPTGNTYDSLPASDLRRCGQLGQTSVLLGKAEVALVWFWSATDEVGKGIRIDVEPTE